jgi:hypothetical protein
MRKRSLVIIAVALTALAVVVSLALRQTPGADALPPGGTNVLNVTGSVTVESRLGVETIALAGAITVQRDDPVLDGGVQVSDAEIIDMALSGASSTGNVTITERSSPDSTGELRSNQPAPEFPAASFFEVFANVSVPASPSATLTVRNAVPLTVRPAGGGSVNAWPPLGHTYQLDPVYNADNDGDTLVDEDGANEDGDGLVDEDGPGDEQVGTCGDDADCDDLEGEDPLPADCSENNSGSGTDCDADGDAEIDEDPGCVPLLTALDSHMPAGICVRNLSLTVDAAKTPTPTRTPTNTRTPTATTTPQPTATVPINDAGSDTDPASVRDAASITHASPNGDTGAIRHAASVRDADRRGYRRKHGVAPSLAHTIEHAPALLDTVASCHPDCDATAHAGRRQLRSHSHQR